MSTSSVSTLPYSAACVPSFCFYGLRENSVLFSKDDLVFTEDGKMTAHLSIEKVQADIREPLVSYHRRGNMASPIDLLHEWKVSRGQHPRFFSIPGEPVD